METPLSLISADDLKVLLHAAKQAPIVGCFVEVGVFRGGSAFHLEQIASVHNQPLHLFDTFTGTPNQAPSIDKHEIGSFSQTDVDEVKRAIPNAIFHVGVFPDTLTDDVKDIAFAHVDCDQYDSVRSCIECLYPRLVPGGIMFFDDFNHLVGAQIAVYQAFAAGFLGDTLRLAPNRRAYVIK